MRNESDGPAAKETRDPTVGKSAQCQPESIWVQGSGCKVTGVTLRSLGRAIPRPLAFSGLFHARVTRITKPECLAHKSRAAGRKKTRFGLVEDLALVFRNSLFATGI